MTVERGSIPKPIAKALIELGTKRGGQVVCAVVMLADEIEFIWPSELDEQQIIDCEYEIVEALMSRWANSAQHGPISL